MADNHIPAAQYVRMSTDKQQYSIENQCVVIQTYAETHGYELVCSYADPGRSGMRIKGRPGLRHLIQDVVSGNAPFKAILVYDVTRWGRFQDVDEAAHYEFLCKSAGVPIIYCAETFTNDDSLSSSVMKAVKRTMAGEYSRELGVRIINGQKRLARLGFKQGGIAGYGLRRMLISPDRHHKQELKFGERKSLAADRVILVPGPPHEVKVIRDIYGMVVENRMGDSAIARELNRKSIKAPGVGQWNNHKVHSILTHAKYAGFHVFGRTSSRLYTPPIVSPRAEWVVTPKAFEPLVDEATFEQAQRILKSRTHNLSDEELLNKLRDLLAREGRLSHQLVTKFMACSNTFRRRFGGLRRAYDLIGYGSQTNAAQIDSRRQTHLLRDRLIKQIQGLFPNEISVYQPNGKWRSKLRLRSNGLLIAVILGRYIPPRPGLVRSARWRISPRPHDFNHIMLLARLKKDNTEFLDFHIFPRVDRRMKFEIQVEDSYLAQGVKLHDLSDFYSVVTNAGKLRTQRGRAQ